jgi:hypothetical protein
MKFLVVDVIPFATESVINSAALWPEQSGELSLKGVKRL